MPEHDRLFDVELFERAQQQARLRLRVPETSRRALAEAEARAIESDHAMLFGCALEQAAQQKINRRDAVAVQKHHRTPLATRDIMQAHAIDFDELANGRIFVFGLLGPRS